MLGISDIIMSLVNGTTEKEQKNADEFLKYKINRKSDITWFCFLPRRTNLDIAKKYNLLPRNGNVIAYEVPLNLIASNPNITKNTFFSLINDFKNEYSKLVSRKIALLGISIGSIPAFYLANRYKADKLRIVCTTEKLGDGIFSAFAARKIKKECIKEGFNAKIYDEILDGINPIKNISNLPGDTKIVISKFDNYIPYKGGLNLINEIKKRNKNIKFYKFLISGHFLTMFRVGRWNKKYNFFD